MPVVESVEERLSRGGLQLPSAVTARGRYSLGLSDGDKIHLAGHGPVDESGRLVQGRIGRDLSVEQGLEAARLAALALIRTCGETSGNLEDVDGVLVLRVSIAAGGEFDPIEIAIAASEVLALAWPSAPPPVRTVVMPFSLPLGVPLVIEATARLSTQRTTT